MVEQAKQELERFKRDTQYFEDHREELLEQYPEQWVAIYNQRVVGADPDYDRLLEYVKDRGIPITHAFFDYLSHQEEDWVL